jgi:hypothetical protein
VRGDRLPSWLPWALCWLSLGLLLPGLVLRIAYPEGVEDGALYAVANVVGTALVPPVGALIATRLPTNPYGWLWCALGLAFAVVAFGDGLRRTDAVTSWSTGALLGAAFVVILCLVVFVFLLFPTGRLPAPGWRWPARAAVLVPAVGILVLPLAPNVIEDAEPSPWALEGRTGELLATVLDGLVPVMFLLILLAAGSVLVRFRRAGPVERQQLKWFLFATAVASATIALDLTGVPISPAVWALVDAISFALLPVSVGIAVLRYRLYEIDRIVSRTVSYGLLTAALVGVYAVVILLLGPVLETLTGGSSLAVVASTLAVAAAFDPVRRRMQAVVDRRFDRTRYDAARAVDAFARRLRNQVDLDEVTAGLRETVGATVAPTRVAVWLRDSSGRAGSER